MNAQQIAKLLNIYPATKKAECPLMSIQRFVRYGDIPFQFMPMAQGILWAVSTGRLHADAHKSIETMSPYRKIKLVVLVAENCERQNDVPAFLNNMETIYRSCF